MFRMFMRLFFGTSMSSLVTGILIATAMVVLAIPLSMELGVAIIVTMFVIGLISFCVGKIERQWAVESMGPFLVGGALGLVLGVSVYLTYFGMYPFA